MLRLVCGDHVSIAQFVWYEILVCKQTVGYKIPKDTKQDTNDVGLHCYASCFSDFRSHRCKLKIIQNVSFQFSNQQLC